MVIESQSANHQAFEMPQQKIGEIERARLGVRESFEYRAGGEEFVAMCARDAFDDLLPQHPIELAAGAAVTIGDEHAAVVTAAGVDQRAYRGGNPLAADCAAPPADSGRPCASQ